MACKCRSCCLICNPKPVAFPDTGVRRGPLVPVSLRDDPFQKAQDERMLRTREAGGLSLLNDGPFTFGHGGR